MPDLKAIYGKFKDKGLEVYAVSVDTEKKDWEKAIQEDGTSWIQVLDGDNAVSKKWQIEYIPNTYLIDKTGNVVAINPNHVALEKKIEELLN